MDVTHDCVFEYIAHRPNERFITFALNIFFFFYGTRKILRIQIGLCMEWIMKV